MKPSQIGGLYAELLTHPLYLAVCVAISFAVSVFLSLSFFFLFKLTVLSVQFDEF